MQPHYIIIIALGIAFYIVNVWQPIQRKPVNCMMCMTAWISGLLGCCFYMWFGLFFIPVGLLSGALFEAISNRYL